ncbi:MAG: hypothetical protein R3E01_24400 [Pirellulaceae bacterium]|nr:hypothetical protein [Planctomycetales bacterium]
MQRKRVRRSGLPGLLQCYVISTVCAWTALWVQVAQACPTCKNGLADSGNGGDLVSGYFWSIVFMMSMPFLILGGLGTYLYLEVRRARARMQDESVRARADAVVSTT